LPLPLLVAKSPIKPHSSPHKFFSSKPKFPGNAPLAPEKLSAEQLKAVEDLVNEKIQEKISVEMMELPKEEALKIVKNLSFDLLKYGDIVKVYKIGDFSAEFCGGPHVSNTSELGHFKIKKEEASSAGVRRIRAVLEA